MGISGLQVGVGEELEEGGWKRTSQAEQRGVGIRAAPQFQALTPACRPLPGSQEARALTGGLGCEEEARGRGPEDWHRVHAFTLWNPNMYLLEKIYEEQRWSERMEGTQPEIRLKSLFHSVLFLPPSLTFHNFSFICFLTCLLIF